MVNQPTFTPSKLSRFLLGEPRPYKPRLKTNTILTPYWWLKKRKLKQALLDYPPPYSPPHRKRERDATPQEVEDNFQYFMAARHDRVAALRAWLDEHFPDTAGKDPFDRQLDFMDAYRGVITPSSRDKTLDIYYTYELPWAGDQAWASLVFDLATALGEMTMERRPGGHWATNWDLSLLPGYRTRFDALTANLLECQAKEFPYRDTKGRPLIVWPDDPRLPFITPHSLNLAFSLFAGYALLDNNWRNRTRAIRERTPDDHLKTRFKKQASIPRPVKEL